jgi:hypothetical protein
MRMGANKGESMETVVTYPQMRMVDASIENTRMVFRSAKKDNDQLIRCTVTRSEVVLEEPCWTFFLDSTFEHCRVETRKLCAQSVHAWSGNRWVDCTFIGEYAMGIGFRSADCTLSPGPMVVDCDFSKAIFNMTLVAADLPTITFPKWPHVTILEPGNHKAELRSLKFSEPIAGWWFLYSGDAHPSYSSKTFNWDNLVRRKREFKNDPLDFAPYTDEVRSTLSKLPYVIT